MRSNTSNNLTLVLSTLLLVGIFALPSVAQAADLGFSYGEYSGLTGTDIRFVVALIIRIVLSLLGVVLLIMMLYAGFTWMTAGGNDEKIGTAKKTITRSAIGIAIILSAYALTTFIFNSLHEATATIN